MREISVRIGLGIALLALWAAGCGQDLPAFSPPLLMDTAGLGEQIPLATDALGPDGQAQSTFPAEARFQAHVVGVAEGAVLAPQLNPDRSAGLALYGPRRSDGLFGLALAADATAGGGRASLAPRALAAGDYLLLVADLSGRGGGYTLRAACQENCEQPVCTPQAFGDYCATGLVREQGCPASRCNAECAENTDCELGFVCRQDGVCVQPPCDCSDFPYEPVCGVDGQTYANTCEMSDCNDVALAHEGPCDPPGCTSDAECPAGMRCEAGVCTEDCDCDGVPTDPVCGTDGLTYTNDCQRQCAGVGLAHQGSCVSCNPEVCDGRDNDCDGLIDEGCSESCASDADCPAGEVCVAGECSSTLPCATNADCPAGQVCTDGLCRPDQECVAEICDGLDNDCDGQVDEDFDLLNDPANCGSCGQACAQDETCVNGTCTAAACQSDADCPAGQVCDAATGQCVAACQTNADCAAGQICAAGLCVDGCASDADCAAGEVCVNGVCEPDGCDTDADGDGYLAMICGGTDCDDRDPTVHPGAPEVCNGLDDDCDGQVDEQGCPQPCASDADCAAGQLCYAGLCLMGCASDADCQPSEVCFNGACVVPCVTDVDCPAGWVCNINERICQP